MFFNLIFLSNLKSNPIFQKKISVLNQNYKLVGHSLLEYSIFKIDVYWISYYRALKKGGSLLKLIYARDIEKDISNQGWHEGLKNNLKEKFVSYKKEIAWLKSKTPDFKKNDTLILLKQDKIGYIIHNGIIKAKIDKEKILELIHLPWIGPIPVDDKLKLELLGNQGS